MNQTKEDINLDLALAIDLEKYISMVLKGPHKIYLDKHWTVPTKEDKKNFSKWRKDSFDREQHRYKKDTDNNVMPLDYLKLNEKRNIISVLSLQPYFSIYHQMISGILVDNYQALASICGIIDHIKEIQREGIQKVENYAKPKITMQAVVIICIIKKITRPYNDPDAIEILTKYWTGKMGEGAINDLKEYFDKIEGKLPGTGKAKIYDNLKNAQTFKNRKIAFNQAIEKLSGTYKKDAIAMLKAMEKERQDLIKTGKANRTREAF